MYLVRHAKAGSRSAWSGPDDLRPLTKTGRRQADALGDLLAERRVTRVVSSPSVRCRQTVEPLETRAELIFKGIRGHLLEPLGLGLQGPDLALHELRGLLEGVPLLERLPDADDLLHREDVVIVIAISGLASRDLSSSNRSAGAV